MWKKSFEFKKNLSILERKKWIFEEAYVTPPGTGQPLGSLKNVNPLGELKNTSLKKNSN